MHSFSSPLYSENITLAGVAGPRSVPKRKAGYSKKAVEKVPAEIRPGKREMLSG
jgi:hypothetical protein